MQNISNFSKSDRGPRNSRQETPEEPYLKGEPGWISICDDLDSGIYVYVSDPLAHEVLYADQAFKRA